MPPMSVLFSCKSCGHSQQVDAKYAGKNVRCPKCKVANVVSASAPSSESFQGKRYSLQDFIHKTSQKDRGDGVFELESDRILELNVSGQVWIKMGAMISYLGSMKFERERVLEKGWKKFLKKSFTGEGAMLTKAVGTGKVYCADSGKKITIIQLNNESIYVNGNDLLAMEDTIDWDVKFQGKVSSIVAAGFFNLKLSGSGLVAITTHYDPMTLVCSPNRPVYTDPNATVAWSGDIEPEHKTDIQFKTFLGRGSGESFQMVFKDKGFVVVQPFEEMSFQGGAPAGVGIGGPIIGIIGSIFGFIIFIVILVLQITGKLPK